MKNVGLVRRPEFWTHVLGILLYPIRVVRYARVAYLVWKSSRRWQKNAFSTPVMPSPQNVKHISDTAAEVQDEFYDEVDTIPGTN